MVQRGSPRARTQRRSSLRSLAQQRTALDVCLPQFKCLRAPEDVPKIDVEETPTLRDHNIVIVAITDTHEVRRDAVPGTRARASRERTACTSEDRQNNARGRTCMEYASVTQGRYVRRRRGEKRWRRASDRAFVRDPNGGSEVDGTNQPRRQLLRALQLQLQRNNAAQQCNAPGE